MYHGEKLVFTRDTTGRATKVTAAKVVFERRKIDGENGETFQIKPVRPLAEIRKEALAAKPPEEKGEFRKPDLVDLATDRRASSSTSVTRPTTTSSARRSTRRRRRTCRSPRPRRWPASTRNSQRTRLRPAHLRRLPAVVRHEDVLGRDAGEVPQLRRRSVEGLARTIAAARSI